MEAIMQATLKADFANGDHLPDARQGSGIHRAKMDNHERGH